jgi:hypothetical protein
MRGSRHGLPRDIGQPAASPDAPIQRDRFVPPGARDKPSDNGPRQRQLQSDVLRRSHHLDLC